MLLCYYAIPLDPRFYIYFSLYFLEMSLQFVYLVQLLHDWPSWEGDSSFVALLRFPHFVLLYQLLSLLRHCDIVLFKQNWKFDTLVKGWLLLTLRAVPYIKNFVCISCHLICSCELTGSVDCTDCTDIRVTEGAGVFPDLHVAPLQWRSGGCSVCPTLAWLMNSDGWCLNSQSKKVPVMRSLLLERQMPSYFR